jgi:HK97 family phage portal protein
LEEDLVMRELLHRLASWLARKTAGNPPRALTGGQWSGTLYTDSYKLNRVPNANEMVAELKGVAWTCASLNASVCASYPPRLYVTTREGQPAARCPTRPISRKTWERLRDPSKPWAARVEKAARIEEVTEHPLLELFGMPTPSGVSLNAFDLWELTQLYLEVLGRAFWYLEPGPFGTPQWIWILPAQNVTPRREMNSPRLVDYYEYRTGFKEERFAPEEVVFFRYPDPRDPYLGGLSPLRACFEQVALTSHYAARKQAIFLNNAIPSAMISPERVLGEEERDRLETQWNQRLREGGAGRVVVAEGPMKVDLLQHSLGDLALLAEMGATKEQIANAFHVPVAFFTTQTNLANLQASNAQHMQQAVQPRLIRRDEKLNEQLLPLFDPSGRLFVASEDPLPVDQHLLIAQQEMDLKYGVVSINEVRGERGLPPVDWGNVPWLPQRWLPTDVPRSQPGHTPTGSTDSGRSGAPDN